MSNSDEIENPTQLLLESTFNFMLFEKVYNSFKPEELKASPGY